MAGLLITGTDTGAGKTWVSWMLVKALREAGIDAVGWKPVCCGEREDAYALQDAGGHALGIDEVNPVWFRTPIAPYPAAELEGTQFDLESVVEQGGAFLEKHEVVICEGVGGWEVPMTKGEDFSDFAKRLGWPVLLVVGNRLGALNHTILTARAIVEKGCLLRGILLNQVYEEQDVAAVTNRGVLESRYGELFLGEVMHGAELFEPDVGEALFGMV